MAEDQLLEDVNDFVAEIDFPKVFDKSQQVINSRSY